MATGKGQKILSEMEIIKSTDDFVTSVEKSLEEIDPNYQNYLGLVVVGTHSPSREKADERLRQIQWARESNIPFLGICWGFQLAVIEFARNVLGFLTADSQELNPDAMEPIIEKMPELRVGQKLVVLYGKTTMQSYWHNYKMNLKYLPYFVKDWHYSINQNEEIVDYMVLRRHPHFVLTQFHPEYQSVKGRPHQVLSDFIEVCQRYPKIRLGGAAGRPPLVH